MSLSRFAFFLFEAIREIGPIKTFRRVGVPQEEKERQL